MLIPKGSTPSNEIELTPKNYLPPEWVDVYEEAMSIISELKNMRNLMI